MEFEGVPFGSLFGCSQRNGLTRPKKVRGSGLPMVNMGELFAHPRINHVEMDLVPVSESESDFLLEPGDLLFARQSLVRAGAGQCSLFVGNSLPTVFESHLIRCRLDTRRTVPDFYFYFFRSPQGRVAMDAIIEQGAGAAGIRGSDLVRIEVPAPRLAYQRWAVDVLRALDDRIDLLRQTNATLESIAQALFKSWFIDFDPVRAKAEGREPEGMDAATAALFPAEFEESALGLIPKGWRVGTVEDLFVLQRGFDLPASQRTDGEFTMFAASGPHGTHCEPMVRGPGVVTGRSGVIGRVFYAHEDYWRLNTALWVKEFKVATPSYAYQYLQTMDLVRLNAGSAVPTLNRNHVHAQRAVVPPSGLVGSYTKTAVALLERVRANARQARCLDTLRDALLPRLISGKLRLPEALAQVEESVA